MADLTITGIVRVVFDRVDTQGSNGTFSKRDIVIQTEEQYPQDISIQFTQDKCDLLDMYKVGENVTIAFNLRGKPGGWVNPQGETKYFNTIQGWKIQRNGERAATNQQPSAPAGTNTGGKVYIHTDTTVPEDAYIAAKWSHEQLVANGKGKWQTTAAPAPPKPTQTAAQFPPGSYPPPGVDEPANDVPF